MSVYENIKTFYGYPILGFNEGKTVVANAKHAYRIACDYDDESSAQDYLDKLLTTVSHDKIEAIVLGPWLESYEESPQAFIDALISHASTLVNLKAVFIGEMTSEDNEISWIIQGSYKPLLDAFPKLEALTIRGATDLTFDPVQHNSLKELIIQSGGLPVSISKNIADSSFPALTHLELWLGDDNYGFDGTAQQYETILNTIISKSPALRYLGVKNSIIQDDIAIMLSKQPWLEQLTTLDLSMGTLGDKGGQALLDSPYLYKLKKLDLEHHYLSDEMMAKLAALPFEVNVKDQQEDDGDDDDSYRYVSVSE